MAIGRPWLPSKGPNSPFSVGPRTLVARTCSRCGELADGDSFPIINAGKPNQARRKVCHKCQNLQKKQDREQRGIGLPPSERPPERLQTSKYRRWTREEDDYLRENVSATSYEDMAKVLGRSLNSVYVRRGILGLPKPRKTHRVEKPWRINEGG